MMLCFYNAKIIRQIAKRIPIITENTTKEFRQKIKNLPNLLSGLIYMRLDEEKKEKKIGDNCPTKRF